MKANEAMTLDTNVTVDVQDAATGALLASHSRHNLVVMAGRNLVRNALDGTAYGIGLTAIAVGTDDAAVNVAQTALTAETDRGGISQHTLADGALTVQRFLGTQEANGQSLKEAGLFAGSTMFSRVTFPVVAKTSGITITITWVVSIGVPA